MLPELLPWLAVLGLLLLKPNRSAHAWSIWLPLLAVIAMELGLREAFDGSLPATILDALCDVGRALAFGLAGVWLAAPFLGGNSRFMVFLKILLVLAPFALLACAGRQGGSEAGGEMFAALITLGLFALTLVTALSLAGHSCRHRFHPVGLVLALLGWLAVCCTAISLPFAVFSGFAAHREAWAILGIAILVSVAAQFAVSLPFIILSFTHSFYRERLRQLLRLERPDAPPVPAPTPPPAPAT